ncbi:MAG: hypothetical protein WDW36_002002 [Sanguina aurantia]
MPEAGAHTPDSHQRQHHLHPSSSSSSSSSSSNGSDWKGSSGERTPGVPTVNGQLGQLGAVPGAEGSTHSPGLTARATRLLHAHLEPLLSAHRRQSFAGDPNPTAPASHGAPPEEAAEAGHLAMLRVSSAMLALGLGQSEALLQAVSQADLRAVAMSHPAAFAALLPAAASCSLPLRRTVLVRWGRGGEGCERFCM